jgi:hypothetical protein
MRMCLSGEQLLFKLIYSEIKLMKKTYHAFFYFYFSILLLFFFLCCSKQIHPKQTALDSEKNMPEGSGTVRIVPERMSVAVGSYFTVTILVNSGIQKVAAYGFILKFDQNIIETDISKGNHGVEPGPHGFFGAVNTNIPNQLFVAGFDVAGKGPGNELRFLIVYFRALQKGKCRIALTVDNLIDEAKKQIGSPKGTGCEITVK